MSDHNRSPIEVLGYHGWTQYTVFKRNLALPFPYLRIVVKNYRDLTKVPPLLPTLLEKIHTHWWNQMNETSRLEKQFMLSGIPALYIRDNSVPVCKATVMQYYARVLDRAARFAEKGKILYLHSDFEANALLAASQIIKACVSAGVTGYMSDFPTCLAEIKTWSESSLLKKMEAAQVACIYMIGKEYSTEFTQSNLEALVRQRTLNNKITLLCTHLSPTDYRSRYGKDPEGTVLKFEDEKIMKTIGNLMKELED